MKIMFQYDGLVVGQRIRNLRIEAGQLLQNTEYMLHEHRKDWDKQTKKQVKEACQRLSKAIGRSTPEKIDEVTASNICEAKDYLENTLSRMGI